MSVVYGNGDWLIPSLYDSAAGNTNCDEITQAKKNGKCENQQAKIDNNNIAPSELIPDTMIRLENIRDLHHEE